MIRHIFCDLDGTLYHNGIDIQDVEAIKEIEEKGIRFHIATGRTFKHADEMTKEKIKLNGYYICENGSYIYDSNHNLIFKGTIDDTLVKKIISRFESKDAKIYFKYSGKIILLEESKSFSYYSKDYIIDPEFINRDNFNNEVSNIGIVSSNREELSRIELYLQSEFRELLDIYFSSEHTLNIVPKGVSKRKAIEKVCNILNCPLDEIVTIGDSPNDINMLEGIKYSFAMENARESVKKSANYICANVKEAIKIIEKINGVE